jgi:hypothetical protein
LILQAFGICNSQSAILRTFGLNRRGIADTKPV